MSKDKGTKNTKKAPADKSLGKTKPVSDYKNESKGKNSPPLPTKPSTKPDGNAKP